ncbi:hypothetical protein FHETE_6818 [Fusarium heterosporum]|uniref:Infection structure specific protein n=1 Tax=Fusarium heterosporum TaxID=42747 RepID=A0A8H5T895_FUSHE|nr:hypothetical protein FHETE_6818 [Fusarium heterosporum]
MQIAQFSLLAAAMAASVNGSKLDQRDIDECTSAASGLVDVMSDMPTADKTLSSFIAKQTDSEAVANSCVIPAVTGSMAAAYTAYAKSMESWVSEFKDDLSSVYDACSDVPQVQKQLKSAAIPISGFCSSFSWATASASEASSAAVAATATAKATNSITDLTTGSATDTASSASTPTNVASNSGERIKGLGAVAVAAIAGLAAVGAC